MRSELVYKILDAQAWLDARARGAFHGSAADLHDRFIHLSSAHQVAGTAAKHFRGIEDLVIVAFDASRLGDSLKWEVSRGGDEFPHLYAPLSAAAAVWVKPMPLGDDGVPFLNEAIA